MCGVWSHIVLWGQPLEYVALKLLALFQSYLWQTQKLIGRGCLYWCTFGSQGMLVEIFFFVLIHVVLHLAWGKGNNESWREKPILL